MVGYGGGPYFVSNLMKDTRFKKRPKGTWERKSNEEIELVKKRLRKSSFNFTFPLAAGCFLFLCFILSDVDSLKSTSILLLAFIVPFSVVMAAQIHRGRSFVRTPSFKVCNKCFKENNLGFSECSCGGIFETHEFYNFKEEETNI